MIPLRYEDIVHRLKLSDFDFKKVRLEKEERFKLEFELLIYTIKLTEPLVYELIANKKFTSISLVKTKIGENRYEIKIGKYWVKCSLELYNNATRKLIAHRFSNY